MEGSTTVRARRILRYVVGYALLSFLMVSLPGVAQADDYRLHLRAGVFDPLERVAIPNYIHEQLQSHQMKGIDGEAGLFIVQFFSGARSKAHQLIASAGGEIIKYLPQNAFIVKATPVDAVKIEALASTRWVGPYLQAFKAPDNIFDYSAIKLGSMRYDLVLARMEDADALEEKLSQIGVEILSPTSGVVWEVNLDRQSLSKVMAMPEILWLEPTPGVGEDMDNARIQGGGDYVEQFAPVRQPPSYTGIGVRGHILEGINPNHPDFAANEFRVAPIAVSDATSSSHGQATYGIVFGDGSGDAKARGMMPNGQGLFTSYSYVFSSAPGSVTEGGRYELTKRLIEDYQVMFQTASWGYDRTVEYTARSLEMDQIIFDLDIPITQSQSNSGNRYSRPQAWAKNIISIGAVYHYDNADPGDDRWDRGASIGPASDGRIKPDLVAFFDATHTTGLRGYTTFGGTSGATPIVAGHVGLALEMWTDALFGNALPEPGTERFKNRPRFTTIKALLINSAKQYDFDSATHDLNRMHQGWGFPDLMRLYDKRDQTFVVNGDQVLQEGESAKYELNVATDASELRVTMTYADPPAVVGAAIHRVNDLDLKVTAPDGQIYWGNVGLLEGVVSLPGGEPDTLNTVENVFIPNPQDGAWTFEVLAREINESGLPASKELVSSFALVVSGIERR